MTTSDHIFRCTYCNRVITRTLTPADLQLAPGEEFVPGRSYPYTGCWCGWGKHVICEQTKPEQVGEMGEPDGDH